MDNLTTALKWAALGIGVFPCHSNDGWVQGKEISMKAPIPKHGFKDATTDERAIRTWWTENPRDLVGLHMGKELVVLDIDVNAEKNKDGWFSLNEKGIEPTQTFNVVTKNGGNHYFYRNQGLKLGPTVGVKLPNGEILEDVDRRAGESYVIAWSNQVPQSLEDLAPTPEWLAVTAGQAKNIAFTGTTTEWLATLRSGQPSPLVNYAKRKFPISNINHQQLLNVTANLVSLGASGEAGVAEALAEFKTIYLQPPFNITKYQTAFESAVSGAIAKFGGKPAANPDDEKAALVQAKVFELEIRQEAERIMASKNFEGSKVLTWDDLADAIRPGLVDDLLPWQGVSLLVGDSNIGKTFAFIDMTCRIATGRKWLGKQTNKAKVLFVLGEGKSGFLARIHAWCEYHSVEIDEIKPWFHFVQGGNLNADTSLEMIRQEVMANKIQLIVYDTWAAVSGVFNENDAALTAETVSRVLKVMPDQSHLFIHHPTKVSGKKSAPIPRGSGALPAAADVVMTLFYDKDGKRPTRSEEWLALSTETTHNGKNRNARTETIHGIKLKKFGDDKVVLHFEESETLKKSNANVRKFLTSEMTIKQYADKASMSESQARRELEEGIADGLVTKNVPLARNLPATYNPKNSTTTTTKTPPEINWPELEKLAPKNKKGTK